MKNDDSGGGERALAAFTMEHWSAGQFSSFTWGSRSGGTEGSELDWHGASSFLQVHACYTSVFSNSWCSVTQMASRVCSLPVHRLFIWWIPAGPELSLDWKHPLGQSVISRLNIKPLLTPVSFLFDRPVPKLAFDSGATAPRELPHLIRKWSVIIVFKRTISKWCCYIVCPACVRAGFLRRLRADSTELLWDPALEHIFGCVYLPPGVSLLITCTTLSEC